MTTLRQKFQALQARMRVGGTDSRASVVSHEVADFDAKYGRLLEARACLRKVETAVKKYSRRAAYLSKSAKAVGVALGTPSASTTNPVDLLTEDEALLKAISAKCALLDETVKQRRKLEELRAVRDYNASRYAQTEAKKTSAEDVKTAVELAKWKTKTEHSQKEYDELLLELTDALQFVDATTRKDGPWALVGPEVEAFRSSQKRFLHSVEGLFAGFPAGTYTPDPESAAYAVAIDAQEQTVQEQREEDDAAKSAASSPARPEPPKPPGGLMSSDEEDDEE